MADVTVLQFDHLPDERGLLYFPPFRPQETVALNGGTVTTHADAACVMLCTNGTDGRFMVDSDGLVTGVPLYAAAERVVPLAPDSASHVINFTGT